MDEHAFARLLLRIEKKNSSSLPMEQGSRVAVIGGGPAGSFFSYFLLDMAGRIGLRLQVDIYEPRDFNLPGPRGCNMCGGVIYESLVQSLAVEGINLPTTVVQRGIEYNKLHMDIGSAQIQTPRQEKRIATTYRGSGPRGLREFNGKSLDGYLLQSAVAKGARHIRARVEEARWKADSEGMNSKSKLVEIKVQGGEFQAYELIAVSSGVNTSVLKLFHEMDFGYQPPRTTKLLVREYYLGEEAVSRYVGPVFHAFLLNIPGLDYGAIIPKGDHITVCLLSSKDDLDPGVMETFLNDPAVKKALPPDFLSRFTCGCGPRINAMGSVQPFGDRIVFIGDSGVSRLYKDGIGAAYRSAKIAAGTAVFHGISAEDFKRHYLPFCRRMEFDNRIGTLLFKVIGLIQKTQITKCAVLSMVSSEQQGKANPERGMSLLMWDMLTGGAPYKEVLLRALHPMFWIRFIWNILASLLPQNSKPQDAEVSARTSSCEDNAAIPLEEESMEPGALGKVYQAGESIVRQGEVGDCMYVIQEGYVEVVKEADGRNIQLAILGKDEFFGEMEVFEHKGRAATVRALVPTRVITIDQKSLLRRIQEDPSLAYRLVQVMSSRIRQSGEQIIKETKTPFRFCWNLASPTPLEQAKDSALMQRLTWTKLL